MRTARFGGGTTAARRAALVALLVSSVAGPALRSAGASEPRFSRHRIDAIGSELGQTALVDVDRDGDLDWIAGQSDRTGGDVWWWEYRGPDDWVRHLMGRGNTDVGGAPHDVDGDGWVDFLAGSRLLLSSGEPRTKPFLAYDVGALYSHDTVFADIDGDGRADALANSDRRGLFWYTIPADPTMAWTAHPIASAEAHRVHGGASPRPVGDLDGDGDADVVTGRGWYENLGGRGLAWRPHLDLDLGEAHRYGLAVRSSVIDLDRDGDADVVQAEADNPDGRVAWFENDGRGGWTRHLIKDEGDGQDFHSLAVADFDGDGDADVLSCGGPLSSREPRKVYVWENRAGAGARPVAGRWTEHVVAEKPCHEAVAGDVDGDGDVDVAFKPWTTGNEHVYLQNRLVDPPAAPLAVPARGADPPATGPAPLAVVCSVRDHGATGVRTQNATRAVQEAVDACHARGGGTAYVPPGEYTTGTIVLKDNVTLWLEAGAVLYLSQDRADFPRERAHVFADGARNVAIRGRGRFDGQARYEWGPPEDQDTEILAEERLAAEAGVDMRRWLRRGLQAMTLLFSRCRDVLIEDVTLVNSTLWNVRLWGCDGVVVRGVTIESDLERAANSDGVDVDGSRNVRISDSRIATADDAIVLKSGKWRWDGRGESFPTENVVVTNCVLSSSSSAFTIGTESYEDFRHIVLSNSVVRGTNRAFGINVQDGATVEDVLIANVTVDLGRRHWNWWGSGELLHFVLRKRTPESRLGAVRNVVVRDVVAHAQGTARMVGHPERPLENITLAGIQLFMEPESTPDKRATHGLLAERVDGLRIRDLDVRWARSSPEPRWQSAVVVRKSREVEITGFVGGSAPGAADVPAVALEDVEGALVRGCRPVSDRFLHLAGASRGIALVGNDFSGTRVPVGYASEDLRAEVASEGNIRPR